MTYEMINKTFSKFGISVLEEIGNNVYLIEHSDHVEDKQVLKVIDITQKAKKEANEKYSEDVVKQLFGIIHANELVWNEKITLTQCEYLVRILEDYTIGALDEDLFLYAIRMPYYKTLNTVLAEGMIGENEIISLGIDICNALRTLHHNGEDEYFQNETVKFGTVLHLDIKPDNIFYDENDGLGTYMLGDFGTVIEKGKPALPMQTSGYYAPEMKDLNSIPNESADIFSLGMVLYRCICDTDEQAKSFWEDRCEGNAVSMPKDCSPYLWNVIEHATRTNPEDRYQSAAEFQAALGTINANKTAATEILKEKAETDATISSAIALIEAGVLLVNFVGKIKKRSEKNEQIEMGQFGLYEGNTKNGNPHGKGTFTYAYGSETKTISGKWEWVQRKKIKCDGIKVIYTGMLCNGKICALGECVIPKTGKYLGVTYNGEFQIGTMEWQNGDSYAGQWASKDGYDWMHGEGVFCCADGSIKSGQWVYGNFIDKKEC